MANGRPLPIRSSRTADPDYLFWTNSYHILLQVWDATHTREEPRLLGQIQSKTLSDSEARRQVCHNPRRVGEEIRQDSELRSLPSMLPDMEISVLPRAAIP